MFTLTSTQHTGNRPRLAGRILDALPPWPVAPLVAVAVFLILRQGGIGPNTWYVAALVLLGLVIVLALAPSGPVSVARPLRIPLAGLATYTLWCYASLAWSGTKGTAWDGANRTLLYLTVLAIFALVPLPRRGADGLLVGYGTAVVAIGAYVFFTTTAGSRPLQAFIGGRLADPIGYPNGNAALFVVAFWCLLPFVASPRTSSAVRLVSAGVATIALDLSLLAQSRGGTAAALLSALVYLALVRDRVRAFGALAVCAGSTALAAPYLFRVYRVATSGGDLSGTLHEGRIAILLSGAGAVVLTGLAVGTGRIARDTGVARFAARVAPAALATAAVVAVLAGGVLALTHRGYLDTEAHAKWRQFTVEPTATALIEPQSSHFTTDLGGGARYDMWRVAWGEFRSHPVTGVGVDNFAADYVRLRRSTEEPSYPHSAILRLFSETGVVGVLLFGTFVVGIGLGLLRVSRRRGGPAAAAAAAVFGYWLLHGAVDWLWEVPAVTISALLVAGAVLVLAPLSETPAPETPAPGAPGRVRLPGGRATLLVIGLPAAAALALPWLALREEGVALATWRTHPAQANAALSRARDLNRLSDQPDLIAGAIAARRRDYPRMRQSFVRAIDRNPSNWYAHLELGALAALQGSKREARAQLATARRQNPRETAIAVVAEGLASGRPVRLASLDRIFIRRVQARTWHGAVQKR
ncbi:MAG: O-antigen ligase family protein [Gaiellaceae bacterium]